jgi:hypothetical protein
MRLATIALTLIFLSSNFANATISKQYIKQSNTPIVSNHEEAKKLANMKVQMEELANQQITSQTDSPNRLTRKSGGKTASTDILGTYRLTDSSLSGSLFLDIIDASIRSDTGAIEFVISDSSGNIQEHSIGILAKNILTMQDVALNGAEYYVINLNPKNNYSGQGLAVFDIFSDNCFEASGDGFIEIGELYACEFIGSSPQLATITLDRLN